MTYALKWPRQKWTHSFTRTNAAYHLNHFPEKIKQCIMTINNDPDQVMCQHQQVQKLLECMRPDHFKPQSVKMMICQNYAANFEGACAFFSSIVSSVYGAAQVKY